jgi:hypothetical protein
MMMMFGKHLKNVVKLKVRICIDNDKDEYLFIWLDVRLVRDSATSVGKGFGYVLFQVCEFMFSFFID